MGKLAGELARHLRRRGRIEHAGNQQYRNVRVKWLKEVFRDAAARPLPAGFLIQAHLEISQVGSRGVAADLLFGDSWNILSTDHRKAHTTSQDLLKRIIQAQDG